MVRTEVAPTSTQDPGAGGSRNARRFARQWDEAPGRLITSVVLGLLIALVTWRLPGLAPAGGIDGSWQGGIAMAFAAGFRWGVEVVWTYGPLGFLIWPLLWVPLLGGLAWIFVFLTHLSLCVTLVWLSSRREEWRIALPLALVAGPLAVRQGTTGELVLLALLVCFELLRMDAGSPTRSQGRLAIAGIGAVAALGGFVILVKLNDGVAILALAAVTSLALTVRLAPLVAIGAGGLVTAALWVAVGQEPSDLAAYIVTGREIASGYSTAMGVSDPTRNWEYAAIPVAIGLVAWVLRTTIREWPRRQQLGALAAVAVVTFLAYKADFVRHGGGRFFELLAVVAVWMPHWTRDQRERRFLVLAVLVVAALGTYRFNPALLVDPIHVDHAGEQAVTLASTNRRVAVIRGAREQLQSQYAVPGSMLAAIGDGGVHVEPFETAVVWAYPALKWRPLPVFQPYSAYTEELDRLNAAALASASGPDFILRQPPSSIDSRQPFFEAPASTLEEVCRFEEVAAMNRWQLLGRRASRCGPAEPLGTITVAPGQLVTVPGDARPNRIVVAHIAGIEAGPLAALRAFVDKSPVWSIWLTDQGKYRLVPETAVGPLIMSSPTSVGWTDPYAPPRSIRSFMVVTGPAVAIADPSQPGIKLTITFESIPFDGTAH